MADQTAIEWTDATFNPWIGCTKVSPGCDHCYAERDMDHRRHRAKWGPGQPRSRTGTAYWQQPLRWNRAEPFQIGEFFECACGRRGEFKAFEDHQGCPLKRARRRVFCASLADVFDNEVPTSWRHDLFALIRSTPNLDWLLLTKRIGNAARMIDECGGWSGIGADGSRRNPLPNVWIGATVVNQDEVDRDVPKLLATPAAVRFLSIEPMLGPITFVGRFASENPADGTNMLELLDWVIAGGESGPGARPMHPDWVRELRDSCEACEVPFLFKQWGAWASVSEVAGDGEHHYFPDGATVRRVGKKAAGRLLDGVQHDGFPEVHRG